MKRELSEALIYAGEQECHLTFAVAGTGFDPFVGGFVGDLCGLFGDPGENVVIPGAGIAVFAGMPDEDILLDALVW